jgi:hypothetical protein
MPTPMYMPGQVIPPMHPYGHMYPLDRHSMRSPSPNRNVFYARRRSRSRPRNNARPRSRSRPRSERNASNSSNNLSRRRNGSRGRNRSRRSGSGGNY